jgi:hypothetical protein
MFAALMIYVIAGDLSWRPRSQPQRTMSGANGR